MYTQSLIKSTRIEETMELDFDKYKEEQFCDNKECPFYGMVGDGNIKVKSRTKRQIYCNSCKNSWVITKNTFFFHLKTPIKDVLETLLLISEGVGVRAISRIKGVAPDSIQDWVIKAADHTNEVSKMFKIKMKLKQCQIDEFWSFIRKKKNVYLKKKKS